MPSPVAHSLLPLAILTLCGRTNILRGRERLKFFAITLFLLNAPDLDLIPAFLLSLPFYEVHRAWGHNIFAMASAAILGVYLYRKFCPSLGKKLQLRLAFLLVASHALLDSFTYNVSQKLYLGVPLLWPFSDSHFYLPLPLFPSFARPSPNPIVDQLDTPGIWQTLFLYELVFTLGVVLLMIIIRVVTRLMKKTAQAPVR